MNNETECPACEGEGMLWSFPCPNCVKPDLTISSTRSARSQMRSKIRINNLIIQMIDQTKTLKPYFFEVTRLSSIKSIECGEPKLNCFHQIVEFLRKNVGRRRTKTARAPLRLINQALLYHFICSRLIAFADKQNQIPKLSVWIGVIHKNFQSLDYLDSINPYRLPKYLPVRLGRTKVGKDTAYNSSRPGNQSFPLCSLWLKRRRRIKCRDIADKTSNQQTGNDNPPKLVRMQIIPLCKTPKPSTIVKVAGGHNG